MDPSAFTIMRLLLPASVKALAGPPSEFISDIRRRPDEGG